jgi:hypothetical protein
MKKLGGNNLKRPRVSQASRLGAGGIESSLRFLGVPIETAVLQTAPVGGVLKPDRSRYSAQSRAGHLLAS